MSTLLTNPPPATHSGHTHHGEFIMAGNLTPLGDPDPDTDGGAAAVMPNYAQREEVQIMMKKIRDRVSLWKRIPSGSPGDARDSVARFVLPQHTMYVK